MSYLFSALCWALIFGGILLYIFAGKSINRKAARSGEDKARILQAVGPFLQETGTAKPAYAHWEKSESYGRAVRTTYYRYVLAFEDRTLWVFPFLIDKKTRQFQTGSPVVLTLDRLGKITVRKKEKNGVLRRVEAVFADKQGHIVLQLYVDAENLRKSRWYPLNLLQQEECEAFERFVSSMAKQAAEENPGIDAMLEAESRQNLGTLGAILSACGVLGGLCAPIFGLILCLIGFILAVVSKFKGAKGRKSLMISILCMIWILFYCWLFYVYLFI